MFKRHFFQFTGKFLLESEDSSRHHSRNSSTGSNIPTSTIVVNDELSEMAVNRGVASATEASHALLNVNRGVASVTDASHALLNVNRGVASATDATQALLNVNRGVASATDVSHALLNHGVVSNLAEEAERLLQPSDQRSSE